MSFGGKPRVKGEEYHVETDFSGDKGKTVQSEREEADINKIIARFEKSGSIARINSKEPFYGDVSMFDGLADAKMKIQEANELFMDYDAKVRERFDNDYVKFIEFLENPDNLDEAISLGIAQPRPEPPQPPVPEPVG